jgi:hypothetical protein
VSVTRAIAFNREFTTDDAAELVHKKLAGLLVAATNGIFTAQNTHGASE